MSLQGLDTLRIRLERQGGVVQEDRMIKDKEKSLRRALEYSYQREIIGYNTSNGYREFKCLLNSRTNDFYQDVDMISIPFDDYPVNEPLQKESTEMKPGLVFKWLMRDGSETHWLVDLQYIQENAYFRADVHRCDQQVEIGGKAYWAYIRGPQEADLEWTTFGDHARNELNYSLTMLVTQDDYTSEQLHRFTTVKIANHTWRVVARNPYYGDGIIQVSLEEYHDDPYAQDNENNTTSEHSATDVYIDGPDTMTPYSRAVYKIINVAAAAEWSWSSIKGLTATPAAEQLTLELDSCSTGAIITIRYGDITKEIIIKPI